ncbi:MAG: PAS domain-containing protein [Betaproteobacteria bacterium]|nr:PAS domain-containing protein [Betaproteobacteria bacterium]
MAKRTSNVSAAATTRKSPDAEERGPSFCVVGMGASAGGLEAFRQLLAALPKDTGLSFVVVQHLAPAHASSLAEILSRSTSMPVVEVKGESRIEPDHVYVIPPAKSMVIADRNLKLQPREEIGQHHPIDLFFKSLAQDQGDTSIGVVLSGTGNDGTAGLREIKAAGGITFAQDKSAQHDGMPRSAIAAQCVDFVLSPRRIAEEIARIAHHPYTALTPSGSATSVKEEPALNKILRHLQHATDVDFESYKPSTIRRRIARRMVLQRLDTLEDYAHLLDQRPEEAAALFQDILIGVTGFFRDPQTFAALQREVFPSLLKNRARGDPLRIWVTGCSTGEEAYSYAIAAAESIEDASLAVPVQVFATDLNAASVDKARAGIYPKSIASDVTETRLRRFFVEADGNYRIAKAIRESVLFARHNVLRDPPFSRTDIISCRNLLIYLGADLQKKLLSELHYALKPAGYLVLGHSETIGPYRQLFEAHDARHKIYRKIGGPGPLTIGAARTRYAGQAAPAAPVTSNDKGNGRNAQIEADRILLAKYAPAAVLVDPDMDIVQFRGDTGAYLMPASGKASLSLLKMAREGLLIPLRAAIHKAKKQNSTVREEGLRLKIDGAHRDINLEVIPVRGATAKDNGFLILFENAAGGRVRAKKGTPARARNTSARAAAKTSAQEEASRLAQELAASREYLQSAIEQHEAVNEELQSANEEAQSANEELQSINEELETSKEEIESTNEELATVNQELQNRSQEVAQINNDLINLLSSLDTAIVMIGGDLRIRRYTPLAEKIFNLIPTDIGRPFTDIKLKLAVADFEQLVAEVIDSVASQEREIQDVDGHWYLLRVRPYETLEAKIDGAVLILIDVDAIRRAREFAENIVATVREPLLVLDKELRIRSASASFCKTFGLPAPAVRNQLLYKIADGEWNIPELRNSLNEVLSTGAFEDLELARTFAMTGPQILLVNARRLVQDLVNEPLILMSMEIVTERRKLEESMRKIERLSEADRNKNEFLAMLAHELRNPLAPLQNALHVLRSSAADEAGRERAHEMMERQIKIMTRLVDDLLDSARVTQGKIVLFRESLELNALLNRVAQAIQPQIERKMQVLSLSLLPEPVHINADATRIEQSLGNLLQNASKFSPAQARISLTAELRYARAAGDAANEVIVRIRDTGAGISAATLPHIFELFMQSDRSLDRAQGGLGIGLTLTRKLLELHGGSIEAYSAGLGQGSEFVVRLPVIAPGPAATSSAAAAALVRPVTKRNILIVDDNIDSAESLAMILRLAGHRVVTAHNPAIALQTAAQIRPDVIVLDIGLPEMNGYELARAIRQQPALANAVLIAVSGYGSEEDRQRGVDAGFDHHFIKPLDYQALNAVLEEAPPPAGS